MDHILQAVAVVVPIIFVLGFGFFAGKTKAFGEKENPIPIINELVLDFALPPMLFVGTILVSRQDLIHDFGLFFVLLACLLTAYFIGFGIAKLFFKRNIVESSIAGLAVSFSAGPFYGPALLGGLYGESSGISISIISLVINVFIVPLATILIKIHISQSQSTSHNSLGKLITQSIYEAIIKTPFGHLYLPSSLFLSALKFLMSSSIP